MCQNDKNILGDEDGMNGIVRDNISGRREADRILK